MNRKYAAVTVATLLVAAGTGVFLGRVPTKPGTWANPDILSIMHGRSPGERTDGAVLVKKGMATLAQATPAPKVTPAAAPAVPVAATPIPTAVTPAPALLTPAVAPAAAPLAAIPAAIPTKGIIFPPVFVPGGGGGHITHTVAPPSAPPPPSGGPPPPVPGVPEPQTWIMMIVGFGFLGLFLRRRRNKPNGRVHAQVSDAAAATIQRS